MKKPTTKKPAKVTAVAEVIKPTTKKPKVDQSEKNLIAAFKKMKPMPVIEFEYRVYYDSTTRECTIKTIDKPKGQFVVVTRERYEEIEFCPHYFVTSHGEIEKKPLDFTPKKQLKLNEAGKYKTLKDNNIFRVDDTYSEDTDQWSIRTINGNRNS